VILNANQDKQIFLTKFKQMRTIMKFRILIMLPFFFLAPVLSQGQTLSPADKKAAEVKKLEVALEAAKKKVALNEKQLNNADSLISTGTDMIKEAKEETKAVGTERKTVDKTYASAKKPLVKQSTSKDKEEAMSAKTEIKALDAQYKIDTKALDTRLKVATKKSTTGTTNVTKGKTIQKTAKDALKVSEASLETAQGKYDAATGAGDDSPAKGKKKK
jgi:hypothetical protein